MIIDFKKAVEKINDKKALEAAQQEIKNDYRWSSKPRSYSTVLTKFVRQIENGDTMPEGFLLIYKFKDLEGKDGEMLFEFINMDMTTDEIEETVKAIIEYKKENKEAQT